MIAMSSEVQTHPLDNLSGESAPLKLAVSGASGMVGSALSAAVTRQGGEVKRLVRREVRDRAQEISWNFADGIVDLDGMNGIDAVVHLAGENIAVGRWTAAKKLRIRESRVLGTSRLCRSLAALRHPPRTLVCASAIGYYGDGGDQKIEEEAAAGHGFLPDVCREWELATRAASDAGIRVVNLRIGIVLDSAGGALQKMLLPFRLGVGGKIGSGQQYWSWITLSDLVRVISFAASNDALRGAVNAVSPGTVTNSEFTRVLGRVLHRPTLFPMPAFAARLALGEMANDLLLSSIRVIPARLTEAGFQFEHADLETALRAVLKIPPTDSQAGVR